MVNIGKKPLHIAGTGIRMEPMESGIHTTILIVDDDLDLTRVTEYPLAQHGFHVLTALNGATALDYLKNQAIEVVLLDLGLPDMNGRTLLRKIKQEWPSIKVIIITGHEDVESYIDTIQHGAFDYLIKPVLPRELIKVIEKVLHEAR